MRLNDNVYVIVLKDGTVYNIEKNEKYINHSHALEAFKKIDDYSRMMTLGLHFSVQDNKSQLLFYEGMMRDGNIVFQNHCLELNKDYKTMTIYLPSNISIEQKKFLESHMYEINEMRLIFPEIWDDNTNKFKSLYVETSDISNGGKILENYIMEHYVTERGIKL